MALGTITDSNSNTISLSQATYTDAERSAAINNAKTSAAILSTIGLTTDDVSALSGANAPSGDNVVATMDDIPEVPVAGIIAGTYCEGNDSRLPTTDQKSALSGTTGTPSSSNPYVTTTDQRIVSGATRNIYVDVNRADTYTEIGSPDRPFKTLTAAITYWGTLSAGAAGHLAYGTYSAGSGVSLPAYPLSINGDGSTITYTGTFTINANFIRRNLITSGGTTLVASGTTIFYGGSVGALTVSGKCYLYGTTITGNLNIQSGGIVYKDFSTVVIGNTINNGTLYTQATISSAFTASMAVVTDASGALASSTTTSTELSYVSGVTSAIQTQINSIAGIVSAVAFEGITAGQFVNLFSDSGILTARLASAATIPYVPVGYALTTATTGNTVTIAFNGTNLNVNSLTVGQVWLSSATAGAATNTPPTTSGQYIFPIGFATSATSVIVNIQNGIMIP